MNPIDAFFKALPPISSAPLLEESGVSVWIKRLDQSHPQISGNKWYKLWHNLRAAKAQGAQKLLTFGGAYSNHIVATAKAAQLFGFASVGLIRGEEHLPLNPVLHYAQSCGMELHYMNRSAYRNKNAPEQLRQLHKRFGDFYLIPEGGSNASALEGCRQILTPDEWATFDAVCLPMGTGGTLAGLLLAAQQDQQVIGFSSLKGGGFLRAEVERLLTAHQKVYQREVQDLPTWHLETAYHFGGFAKQPPALKSFMTDFERQYSIPLDRVYTAKMAFGALDLLQKGFFERGQRVLLLHTGGLPRVLD